MNKLMCETPECWELVTVGDLFASIQLLTCPDCGAFVYRTDLYITRHIQFHRRIKEQEVKYETLSK